MHQMPTTLDKWRDYLAESFKPLVTIGSIEVEQEVAKYETGGRILEMQEHLEREEWITLLAERGITPAMQTEYIQCFLAEVTDYVLREHPEAHQP